VGYAAQPDFLNAVVEVETSLPPAALLEVALDVERRLGRERRLRWGPRNVDIDLLLYDDVRIDEPGLTVPHPYLHERAFVLVPLAEIAPDLLLPDGRSAQQAAEEVKGHADLSIYCQGCDWRYPDRDAGCG
jgi:2-amino-4-hydroxy-6-hydroxymethyldihydropteridine diphosphokinase